MSDSYDDYETAIQLAEHAWEQALEEKQEPVAFRNKETGEFCSGGFMRKEWSRWTPLYAAPPKKQWVGLTDQELEEMHNEIKVRLMGTYRTEDIYRSIEAKLKEKNT